MQFVGDAVMAVFGLPHAHDDVALRAVRAGLMIRDRTARLGESLGLPVPLRVRVGVNSGVVVAGTRRYQRVPTHISAGPMAMKAFGPYLPASAPNRELRNTRKRPEGMNASPAAAAVNPTVPCTNSVT